jgi:hypothetical protein
MSKASYIISIIGLLGLHPHFLAHTISDILGIFKGYAKSCPKADSFLVASGLGLVTRKTSL